ncbi:MAG: hypothetical protein AB1721_01145, partial [Patescibacteria group bacterium]
IKNSWDNIVKTLIHEYIHIVLFDNQRLRKIIRATSRPYPKFFNKISWKTGLPKEVIAEEMLVSSLIPEGELSNLLFPKLKPWITSRKADVLEESRKRVAEIMKPYVVERHQNKITIGDYLSKLKRAVKSLDK